MPIRSARIWQIARRALLVICGLMLAWSVWLALVGGYDGTILGIRLRSNNPRRVLIGSAAAFVAYLLAGGRVRLSPFLNALRKVRTVFDLRPHWVAVVLATAAVIVAWTNGTRIAGGADAYGYVSQADLWLAGELKIPQRWVAEVPWPNSMWTFTPLGYRPAAEWSIVPTYSPGLPMLMAVAKSIGGQCALFAVVPLSLGVAVFATYALGKRLASPDQGLIAAWFVATSPAVLEVSLESLSDVPAMAAWAAALCFLIGTNLTSAALAGLAAALGVLIRPNLVPLIVPMGLWFLLRRATDGSWSRRLRSLAIFGSTLLPSIAVVAALNRYLYGSAAASGYGALDTMFEWSHVVPNLTRFIAWIAETQTPLALLGLAALVVPLRSIWAAVQDRRLFVVTGLFVALLWGQYSAYLVFDSPGYLRFLLPSWPLIMLGFAAVLAAIGRLTLRFARGGKMAITTLTVLLGIWNIRVAIGRDVFEQRQAARHEAPIGRLVQQHTDRTSVILAVHRSGSLRYYAGRMTMRYDMLEGDWLDRTVAWFRDRGVHVYAILDERETEEIRKRFAGQKAAAAFERPVLTYKPASTSLFDVSAPPDRSKPTIVVEELLADLSGCDPPVPLAPINKRWAPVSKTRRNLPR